MSAIAPQTVEYRRIILSRKTAPCPKCGTPSRRHSEGHRLIREMGELAPIVLEVIYSKHYCRTCRKHFSTPMGHLAPANARFTNRVRRTAVGLVLRDALTLDKAARRMAERHFVHVPPTTLHDWIVETANA